MKRSMVAVLVMIGSAAYGQTSTLTYVDSYSGGALYPARLAPAAGGGVYVTDPPNAQVVEYDSGGLVVNTFAVPEGPVGIGVHPSSGNLFISRLDGAVGIYDASFGFLSVVDPAPFTMTAPNDIAIHPVTGEVFVTDSEEHAVSVFDGTTGLLLGRWGSQGSGMSEFQSPQAIAIDPALDRVIVADVDNFRIQVFDTSGVFQFKFGYRTLYVGSTSLAWMARSEGLALDSCGNIHLSDALMGTVRVFSPAGQEIDPGFLAPVNYGPGAGELRLPCDLMIDSTDRLFIASELNGTVEVFDISCAVARQQAPTRTLRSAVALSGIGPARPGILLRPAETPDNPIVIVEAMNSGTFDRMLDLNEDRQVNLEDLQIAVGHFGAATVDDFLSAADDPEREAYPDPLGLPHMIDAPVICGRCHNMDGAPGGMLSSAGQENLCQSCHMPGGRAMGTVIAGSNSGNSHPWGIPANANGVAGPDPTNDFYELGLHLDGGDIRCGTCHDPHELGTNWCEGGANDGNECVDDNGCPDGACVPGSGYLRDPRPADSLCKQCHRGEGAPIDHAVGLEHGPEHCTDCHDPHAFGNNASLIKESMYSWYINGFTGGLVNTGFTDNTIGVGNGGFIDPDAGEFGLCDVCHAYYDDSQAPPVVSQAFLDLTTPHDENMPVCTQCHIHHNGFEPGLAGFGLDEYVSADVCSQCHVQTHIDWTGTIHSEAFNNLPPFAQDPAMGCVACHTVGFGELTGFVDFATTPELAGVQCENCHGKGSDHVSDPLGITLPLEPTDAAVCGACHTDAHHPTFDEWGTSGHAGASAHAYYGSCDECHAPLGADRNGVKFDIECAACHDPHMQTGNDAVPNPPYDSQLLHPEVVTPPAVSNTIADAQDASRFNLCGQCHHSRGRAWDYEDRAPHHSVQGNVYFGEMPVPDGIDLVAFAESDHVGLELQCNTCHMYTAPHQDAGSNGIPPEVDAITGHSWHVDFEACASCHGSAATAQSLSEALQAQVQARLDAIAAALGDPANWEFIAGGGPPNAVDCAADPGCSFSQDDITDDVKKARFMYHYILGDASLGVHNTDYTVAMLDAAESLVGVTAAAADYVGTEVCLGCHGPLAVTGKDYTVFLRNGHSYKLNEIQNDQVPSYPFSSIDGALAMMADTDDADPSDPHAGTDNTLGTPLDYADVSFVIGGFGWKSRWIDADGFIVTGTDVQYNLETSGMVAYHNNEVGKKYNCGNCHTTGWKAYTSEVGDDRNNNRQNDLPGMAGTFAAPGVHCEACHGAGSLHLMAPSSSNITRLASDRATADFLADDMAYGKAASCADCHTRDAEKDYPTYVSGPGRIAASGGLIKHHEQFDEMKGVDPDDDPAYAATGPHAELLCGACHDPHTTTRYMDISGDAPGMNKHCTECHNASGIGGRDYLITTGGMTALDCIDCHMPKLAKSAVAHAAVGTGPITGDIRTHIFRIDLSNADQFTLDGSFAYPRITGEFACKTCHNNVDSFDLGFPSAITIHGSTAAVPDATRGGLLYDKWWKVNGVTEPTGDHPLYPAASAKSGSTTFRCKECHGWDYIGLDGRYESGSHFTGIVGVLDAAANMTDQQIFDIIKNPDGDGTGGTSINGHDFATYGLTDADIDDLVAFIKTGGVVDISPYINTVGAPGSFIYSFNGDPVAGEALFSGATNAAASCSICHGYNGTAIDFGGGTFVGAVANSNPQETLHKMRLGHPGSRMTSYLELGMTDQQAADAGAYSVTLP